MLPTDPKARKNIPIYSGFDKYFPRARAAVAEASRIGNDQHNPGKPLHWDRSKSGDELDALQRHLTDHTLGPLKDSDGVYHLTKAAWRAMAALEKLLEAEAEKNAKPLGDNIPFVDPDYENAVAIHRAKVVRERRCVDCKFFFAQWGVAPCCLCSDLSGPSYWEAKP